MEQAVKVGVVEDSNMFSPDNEVVGPGSSGADSGEHIIYCEVCKRCRIKNSVQNSIVECMCYYTDYTNSARNRNKKPLKRESNFKGFLFCIIICFSVAWNCRQGWGLVALLLRVL